MLIIYIRKNLFFVWYSNIKTDQAASFKNIFYFFVKVFFFNFYKTVLCFIYVVFFKDCWGVGIRTPGAVNWKIAWSRSGRNISSLEWVSIYHALGIRYGWKWFGIFKKWVRVRNIFKNIQRIRNNWNENTDTHQCLFFTFWHTLKKSHPNLNQYFFFQIWFFCFYAWSRFKSST